MCLNNASMCSLVACVCMHVFWLPELMSGLSSVGIVS